LAAGVLGEYPTTLIEVPKEKVEIRHVVNDEMTRPWLKHYFISQSLRLSATADDTIARNNNLLEIFKTTVPLSQNSYTESSLSSWRLFLDGAFREADASWYTGIRKTVLRDRLYSSIEQLELEMPLSNAQRAFHFQDHTRAMRRIPRIPVKLFFAMPGNEREKLIEILSQSVIENPHNVDVMLLTYAFYRAWDRTEDFLLLARTQRRTEMEEWYHWAQNEMQNLGTLKRAAGDYTQTFFIYDRAAMTAPEYKEVADWFLKESEFKAAYHFYYKAKEFETAIGILQNISTKEFADLTNQRRMSKGEKPLDVAADAARLAGLYQEETETLHGFVRIRAAETYKHVAAQARQHFDRETIETKYAFGELSDDEYHRLIRQLQERAQ
jgi:tetratricopeptide (TPR) repeat protein